MCPCASPFLFLRVTFALSFPNCNPSPPPPLHHPPCLCKVICRREDYCSPSWWPWLGWRDAYTDEDECSYSLAEVCLFQGTLALMTWLIGCPKSREALINHPADWIQSSASPAQWWTGKDTAQVLTWMHSRHRRQHHCQAARQKQWGDVHGRGGTPLLVLPSMSSSHWLADRQHSLCHLIIIKGKRERGSRTMTESVCEGKDLMWYPSIQEGHLNDASTRLGVSHVWGPWHEISHAHASLGSYFS